MALINCPECGREVSDKANVCVHCGYQLSKGKIKIACDKRLMWTLTIIDEETGKELTRVSTGEVVDLHIEKDTNVIIRANLFNKTRATLSSSGTHYYEITSGKFGMGLVLREITSITAN